MLQPVSTAYVAEIYMVGPSGPEISANLPITVDSPAAARRRTRSWIHCAGYRDATHVRLRHRGRIILDKTVAEFL